MNKKNNDRSGLGDRKEGGPSGEVDAITPRRPGRGALRSSSSARGGAPKKKVAGKQRRETENKSGGRAGRSPAKNRARAENPGEGGGGYLPGAAAVNTPLDLMRPGGQPGFMNVKPDNTGPLISSAAAGDKPAANQSPYNKTLFIAIVNTLIAAVFALTINHYTESRLRNKEFKKNAAILYSDLIGSSISAERFIKEQDEKYEVHIVCEVPHSGLLGSVTENYMIYLNSLREKLSDEEYDSLNRYYQTCLQVEALRKKYLFYQVSGYLEESKPMSSTYALYREQLKKSRAAFSSIENTAEKLREMIKN